MDLNINRIELYNNCFVICDIIYLYLLYIGYHVLFVFIKALEYYHYCCFITKKNGFDGHQRYII